MPKLLREADLALRLGGTVKFEGAPHGSGASFFHVKARTGTGASLHKHPYPETWIVLAGKVRFTVGDEHIETESGHVVVAEAEIPHKFVNIGDELLELVCIHPSPQIIQEDLE